MTPCDLSKGCFSPSLAETLVLSFPQPPVALRYQCDPAHLYGTITNILPTYITSEKPNIFCESFTAETVGKCCLPRTMEPTQCSETSAYIIRTPGKFPKEYSLKVLNILCYLHTFFPTHFSIIQCIFILLVSSFSIFL